MKIAILSPWTVKPNSVGGTERFTIDLAESFAKEKNIVDVYMLSGEEYQKNGVNYKTMNLFGNSNTIDEYFLKEQFDNFNSIDSFDKLAKKIEEKIDLNSYDLIQLNSQLFLKVARNKERIFTIHTNPFEYKLDWGEESFINMLNIMKKEYNETNTHFVAPSKYYADFYESFTSVIVNYIPHAIDISRLNSNKTEEDIKKEFNISKDKKIILLPSRLEPIQKQPMLFLKAFASLDDDIKNQYVVICTGADKQYEKFKDDIINFSKENGIDILVKRFETMADGYKASSVVVLPSKSESFGYSALESISLGIPTIINSIPTYNEIVKDAKNCYSFDNNEESLSKVLKEVLTTNNNRVKQDDKWNDKYSLELFCKRYLSLMVVKENIKFTTLKEHFEYIDEYIKCCKEQWSIYSTKEELENKIKNHKQRIIKNEDHIITVLLMMVERELIGFISLLEEDGKEHRELYPWVGTFYVKSKYRNHGHSKTLFAGILQKSIELGYDMVYFKSHIRNYYDRFFNAQYMEELEDGQYLYYIKTKNKDKNNEK